ITEVLGKLLFPLNEPDAPQGLLVLSGLTNSGKSNITRGLIWHILAKLQQDWKTQLEQDPKPPRCVHLLTFEDPIETPICSKEPFPLEIHDEVLKELRVNCTTRELDKDAASISEVLRDALRQT